VVASVILKILNICEFLPLDGLGRENDMQIRLQQEINKIDDSIEFVFLKSLPWSSRLLTKIKLAFGKLQTIGTKYRSYLRKKEVIVGGYRTILYPWFMLPTSNYWVNYWLLPFNKVWAINKIEDLIGKEIESFDLIISQNNIADGIVANYLSQKYKIPYIHVLRGNLSAIWSHSEMQRIINGACQCITPSPVIYDFMRKQSDEVLLFPHGVGKEFFFKGKKDLSKVRFITVARFLYWKNIDWVIRVLGNIQRQSIDFEYVLVGDGPKRAELEKQVHDSGLTDYVKFTGWLSPDDVISHLFASNVMVLPSYPEILGRVYLEAAAAKCLCIGHEGSGVDGLLLNNKSAIFCNEKTIGDKIVSVIKNLDSRVNEDIINNAFAVVSDFTWRNVARRYIDLFEQHVKN
jgi:glycosyltransferase involved in cell wall biosynthesis